MRLSVGVQFRAESLANAQTTRGTDNANWFSDQVVRVDCSLLGSLQNLANRVHWRRLVDHRCSKDVNWS